LIKANVTIKDDIQGKETRRYSLSLSASSFFATSAFLRPLPSVNISRLNRQLRQANHLTTSPSTHVQQLNLILMSCYSPVAFKLCVKFRSGRKLKENISFQTEKKT